MGDLVETILGIIGSSGAVGVTDEDINAALPGDTDAVRRMEAHNSLIERSFIQLMGDMANPR